MKQISNGYWTVHPLTLYIVLLKIICNRLTNYTVYIIDINVVSITERYKMGYLCFVNIRVCVSRLPDTLSMSPNSDCT